MDNNLDKEQIEREKHLARLTKLVLIGTLFLASAIFLNALTKCSIEPREQEQTNLPNQCIGGLGLGETLKKNCPEGQLGEIIVLCKEVGKEPELQTNTCKPAEQICNKVTFDDHVKPILSAKCVSCHFTPEPIDKYEVAFEKSNQIIRRVYLDEGNIEHMPKNKPSLPINEKEIFEDWKRDGYLKNSVDCKPAEGSAVTSWYDIEKVAQKDLDRVDKNDKIFTRWCEAADSVRTEADAIAVKKAVDKTLNSIDNRNINVSLTTLVDRKIGLLRFDLRSYDLSRTDWVDFENSEPFDFVSNTDSGKILRLLTATVKPIVHCSNLVDIINTDADLYYSYLNVPDRFIDLTVQQGVRFADDLRNFEASMLGFNGSPISLNKNRMLIRHKSDYGYMWNTQDTKALNNIRERNIFFAPLTKETGSLRIFDFAAGETIWSLPNGGQAYALHDKNGILQKEAPIDVVIDNSEGATIFPKPIIAIASACHNCHTSGILVNQDQVRNKLIGDTSFNAQDRVRIQNLYKGQASNDANFKVDNERFGKFLVKLGITPGEKDPINVQRVYLRSDWSASKLGAFMGLDLPKFLRLLEQSERGKAEIGQLLRGGTATYDAVLAIIGTLIEDFQILEERVDGD